MCIEDIRLGRKTFAGNYVVRSGTGDNFAAGNDRNRVALIFGAPDAGSVTLAVDGTPTADEGIVIANGDAPFKLNIRDDGALVTSRWRVAFAGGATILPVFTVGLEEQ